MGDDDEMGFNPAAMLQGLREAHDKEHMRIDAEKAREQRFLDSLDVEGLLALDWILSTNPERAFANNCRYSGIIETILRLKHGADMDGKPLDQIPED
ncbi:hypothetical protein [Kineococcus sp. NPDC059986]|uniref:hypothetical protein n=1 Tax=Kineococcus sp. NPDC059986 TaxID=3155538 RepID=UPI00344DEAA7